MEAEMMIDNGASSNFMAEGEIRQLGLRTTPCKGHIKAVNQGSKEGAGQTRGMVWDYGLPHHSFGRLQHHHGCRVHAQGKGGAHAAFELHLDHGRGAFMHGALWRDEAQHRGPSVDVAYGEKQGRRSGAKGPSSRRSGQEAQEEAQATKTLYGTRSSTPEPSQRGRCEIG